MQTSIAFIYALKHCYTRSYSVLFYFDNLGVSSLVWPPEALGTQVADIDYLFLGLPRVILDRLFILIVVMPGDPEWIPVGFLVLVVSEVSEATVVVLGRCRLLLVGRRGSINEIRVMIRTKIRCSIPLLLWLVSFVRWCLVFWILWLLED